LLLWARATGSAARARVVRANMTASKAYERRLEEINTLVSSRSDEAMEGKRYSFIVFTLLADSFRLLAIGTLLHPYPTR
jgi:hypothetical protein